MSANLESLRRALEQSPDNLPLLLLYARSCEDSLQLYEAQQGYERILKLDSDHAQASIGIARILLLHNKTSEAAVRVERVLLKDGGFAEGHFFLARVLLAEGNRKGAHEHYLRAREIDGSLRDGALEREFEKAAASQPAKARADRGIEAFGNWSPFEQVQEPNDGFQEKEGYEDAGFFDFLESSLERSGLSLGDVDNPDLDFADIGGLDDLKELVRMRLLYPFRKAELFERYGQQAGGCVLLYGPPGCGKTRFAKAVAGEVDVSWFSLGLHQILDSHFGRSEKNLHELFELARRHAPSVILFDEVESLAGERRDWRGGRGVVNQFIAELDALAERNPGVLVIGATSAPWQMDTAFLRAGRFDRPVFVPPPDLNAREQIVRLLMQKKPGADLTDSRKIAKRTRGYSGADLRALIDLATEAALSKAIDEDAVVPLTTKMILDSIKRVKALPLSWFEIARKAVKDTHKAELFNEIFTAAVAD